MRFAKLITAASIALLPLTAGAATLIIPAAGTGPGANNTRWQSEVTLHNTATRSISVVMTFHDGNGAGTTATQTVGPRSTVSLADVVRTHFNRESGTGAIEIAIPDADSGQLAVASRVFNVTEHGELGQDVPAVKSTDAAQQGDLAIIAGPSNASAARFNFGIYAVADTTVHWSVVHADGTESAAVESNYTAGQQFQYNDGVNSFLHLTAENSDVIAAAVTRGSAIFYGSAVDNTSNDPSFVNAARTRIESRIAFAGVDRDDNGTVDIPAHDGVLDRAVDATTYGFPSFFRIVVAGADGQPVHFEIVSSPVDTQLVDANGLLQIAAGAALKGQTIEIKLRVTTSTGEVSLLTIPVRFM